MDLTTDILQAGGVPSTLAARFIDPLRVACRQNGIDRPARVAAFLANAIVETTAFLRTSEDLAYSTPERIAQVFPSRVTTMDDARALVRQPQKLANRVYAGRLGNGDEASGDGWRYRGRGLFQLTGRANYAAAGQALGRPYLSQPDLVALPPDAALTAAWFWRRAGCNELADARNLDAITRHINGPAMLKAAARRELANLLLRAINEAAAATQEPTQEPAP